MPAREVVVPSALSVAVVREILPNDRYRLTLASGAVIEATVPAASRGFFNRVRVGDRVEVEVSPYDPSKGRLVAPASTPAPRADAGRSAVDLGQDRRRDSSPDHGTPQRERSSSAGGEEHAE